MAKQKGIHQLKGKVGDMSYFQMAGVQSGLVRRIPEGLSSRVKNDEVYANTRLNNREFTNAALISKAVFNSVPNRVASMMRRFAFAEMLKEAKQYIVNGSGNWGQRIPTTGLDVVSVDLLENHAKFGPYDNKYGAIEPSAPASSAFSIGWSYDSTVYQLFESLGVDGLVIKTVVVAIGQPTYIFDPFLILGRSNLASIDVDSLTSEGADENLGTFPLNASAFGLSSADWQALLSTPNMGFFTVTTFLPYRRINSVNHPLYELATFASIALGKLASA